MTVIDGDKDQKKQKCDKPTTTTIAPSSVFPGANYAREEEQEKFTRSKAVAESFGRIKSSATPASGIVFGSSPYTAYYKEGKKDESFALLTENDGSYRIVHAKTGTVTTEKGTFPDTPVSINTYLFDANGHPKGYEKINTLKCSTVILSDPGTRDMESFTIAINGYRNAYNNAAKIERRDKIR